MRDETIRAGSSGGLPGRPGYHPQLGVARWVGGCGHRGRSGVWWRRRGGCEQRGRRGVWWRRRGGCGQRGRRGVWRRVLWIRGAVAVGTGVGAAIGGGGAAAVATGV